MTEPERNAKRWLWAQRLFTRWHAMHGLRDHAEAWQRLDEWDKGYWFGVAEFVFEWFDEKPTR